MNAKTEVRSKSFENAAPCHRTLGSAEALESSVASRPRRFPKVVRERPKQPTTIDARISSLKLLALTLLAQVESLEKQVGGDSPDDLDLQTEVRRFEAELIRSALIRTGGRQRRAAQLLGMKVTTLNAKIRRHKITPEEVSGLTRTAPGSLQDNVVTASAGLSTLTRFRS